MGITEPNCRLGKCARKGAASPCISECLRVRGPIAESEVRNILALPVGDRTLLDLQRVLDWILQGKVKAILLTAARDQLRASAEEAEDVLQSVLLRLFEKKFRSYKSKYLSPVPWLYVIVIRYARYIANKGAIENARRTALLGQLVEIDKLSSANLLPIEFPIMIPECPETAAMKNQDWALFDECTRTLGERDGAVMRALAMGRTHEEVAKQFGLTNENVRQIKRRSTEKVKACIEAKTGYRF